MKLLVIGGTGTISANTVGAAVAAGHEVTSFNRSGTGTRVITGDRRDRVALAAAIEAIRPDALIDFVCFILEDAEALAGAATVLERWLTR